MMRIACMGCLAILVVCLFAASLQARLGVVLQQADGFITTVEEGVHLVTSNNVKYLFDNKEVAVKGGRLQGQNVHILYYEANYEKYCVDLRPAEESAFDMEAIHKNQNMRQRKKKLY